MKPNSLQKSTPTCPCTTLTPDKTLHRRHFLSLAAGGALAGLLLPSRVQAADANRHNYAAFVVSCIDPRIQNPAAKYLEAKLDNKEYSQVNIAGAAIGAVAPRFKEWHETFWENLAISLKLHRFSNVIAIQHQACGAAKEAYGYSKPHSPSEKELHRAAAMEFKKELHRRHPQLTLQAVLMDLHGGTEDLLKE